MRAKLLIRILISLERQRSEIWGVGRSTLADYSLAICGRLVRERRTQFCERDSEGMKMKKYAVRIAPMTAHNKKSLVGEIDLAFQAVQAAYAAVESIWDQQMHGGTSLQAQYSDKTNESRLQLSNALEALEALDEKTYLAALRGAPWRCATDCDGEHVGHRP